MMVITQQHQIIGVSMVGGFHQALWRDSPGWGDMGYRPEGVRALEMSRIGPMG